MSSSPSGAAPPIALLGEWSAELSTSGGIKLFVRPASPEDEERVRAFYASLAPGDLRFRFLTPLARLSESLLDSLVNVDHVRTEDFLAFAEEAGELKLIATAMLAAAPDMERAEVAIAVLPAYKGCGVGWTLLDFVARDAAARGIKRLESIESRENRRTIELEREMGFTATPYPDDATLILLSKRLAPPARPAGR